MLARRVITRPATTIRLLKATQFQGRFTYSSGYQFQALPPPNSWLGKLRFRADGKPRSKLIALGFGSLIVLNVFLLYKRIKATEEGDLTRFTLAIIIRIQRMDTRTYDSVNFDDPISTLSYYKKIFHIIAQLSDEDIDDDLESMTYFFQLRTAERGSKLFAEAQAHQIMRSAAERIHVYFREILDQEPYGEGIGAFLVLGVMMEAHISLLKLMRVCVIEEYKHLQTLSSSS